MSKQSLIKNEVKYLPGMPKEYRANCSGTDGHVKDFVSNEIHKNFKFHPIAYRFFTDQLFDDKAKNFTRQWVELFFIDDMYCMSTIMFHSYSVDNLKKLMSHLFYAGHDLHEAQIEVSFDEKKNKEGKKFYIANFELSDEQPDDKTVQKMQEALAYAAEHQPYRGNTRTQNAEIELSFNYPEIEQLEDVEI